MNGRYDASRFAAFALVFVTASMMACGAENASPLDAGGAVPSDGGVVPGDATFTDGSRTDDAAAAGDDAVVADASLDGSSADGGSSSDATVDATDARQNDAADAGAAEDAAVIVDPTPVCVAEPAATLCGQVSAQCGSVEVLDACGIVRTVDCGSCASGVVCGAAGVPNRCDACVPDSPAQMCSRYGKTCGAFTGTDNCGSTRTVPCGTCTAGSVCSAANTCACVPETDGAFCTRLNAECGAFSGLDNCGVARSVGRCGECRARGYTCGTGATANRCVAAVCSPPATTPNFVTPAPQAPPASFSQGVCDSAQVSAFVAACLLSSASPAGCSAWRAANAACAACVVSPEGATTYGPLVSFSAAVDPATNPLGLTEKSIDRGLMACLDHFRVGCGAAFVADANCLRASCDQNVVCAAATPSQIATCRSAAQTSVCAQAYGTAFDTTGGLCRGVVSASGSPALPGDGCLPTASESPLRTDAEVQSYVSRLVLAFCGP